MSTLEDRVWDAQQDRISDDQHARKVSEATASPRAVVSSLRTALEQGAISTVDGGLGFEHNGLPVELIFDGVEGHCVAATLWVDDERECPIEIANVHIAIEVQS